MACLARQWGVRRVSGDGEGSAERRAIDATGSEAPLSSMSAASVKGYGAGPCLLPRPAAGAHTAVPTPMRLGPHGYLGEDEADESGGIVRRPTLDSPSSCAICIAGMTNLYSTFELPVT